MMSQYAVLIAGIVCAGLGGELFVRGAVGLARSMRISPGIVGATVAAFATSSPELSVSISSALAGKQMTSRDQSTAASVQKHVNGTNGHDTSRAAASFGTALRA